MASPRALLDTDILSAIMKRNATALSKARQYLAERGRFTFSLVTRYEILRGLKAKDARKQTLAFDRFCARNEVLSLDEQCIVKAADIYADLHKRGSLIGDADILVAATAQVHGLKVITNNETHFRRVADLEVENWLVP